MNCITLSDFILTFTGALIAWQAFETRRLVVLTRIKDQPLLEVEFGNAGADVTLKNIGQSPAYSPSISSIEIENDEHLHFDPLHTSRLPIMPEESRQVWMQHQRVSDNSISSFVESYTVLMKTVLEASKPIQICLQYFDKDGVKLFRKLYIKASGTKIVGNKQIYTTTNSEA